MQMNRLVVVSGLSGSGKSVALNMLEDLGWYCIDNIPAGLVQSLVSHSVRTEEPVYRRLAVGLDARNRPADLASIPALVTDLSSAGLRCDVVYLHAEDDVLLRRYADTRRRHPLAAAGLSLADAIAEERRLLHPLIDSADLVIDTSRMSVHELRDLIGQRVEPQAPGRLSIMFESFGFKHGTPGDADFVFDARTLPNPYWEPALQALTGRDSRVIEFLESSPRVARMTEDLIRFLENRLPEYESVNRGYLTIAIGCTGGQHRSVYLVERLAAHFRARYPQLLVRHNALPR
jgi:RNase adapter protein RapZ